MTRWFLLPADTAKSQPEMKDTANQAVQDLASRQQQQQELDLDWAGPASSAPAEAPNVCCRAMLSAKVAGPITVPMAQAQGCLWLRPISP